MLLFEGLILVVVTFFLCLFPYSDSKSLVTFDSRSSWTSTYLAAHSTTLILCQCKISAVLVRCATSFFIRNSDFFTSYSIDTSGYFVTKPPAADSINVS